MALAYAGLIAFMQYSWTNHNTHTGVILLMLVCWIVSLVMRAKTVSRLRLITLILSDAFLLYHGAIGFGLHRWFYPNTEYYFKPSHLAVAAGLIVIVVDWVYRFRQLKSPA